MDEKEDPLGRWSVGVAWAVFERPLKSYVLGTRIRASLVVSQPGAQYKLHMKEMWPVAGFILQSPGRYIGPIRAVL